VTDAGTSASEVRTAGPPWGEGMDAKCLTTQQRGAVRGQVMRQREYLGKLVERLDALGFPEADPVRVAAVGACRTRGPHTCLLSWEAGEDEAEAVGCRPMAKKPGGTGKRPNPAAVWTSDYLCSSRGCGAVPRCTPWASKGRSFPAVMKCSPTSARRRASRRGCGSGSAAARAGGMSGRLDRRARQRAMRLKNHESAASCRLGSQKDKRQEPPTRVRGRETRRRGFGSLSFGAIPRCLSAER